MNRGQQNATLFVLAGLGFQSLEVIECASRPNVQSRKVATETVNGFDAFIRRFMGQCQAADTVIEFGVFSVLPDQFVC